MPSTSEFNSSTEFLRLSILGTHPILPTVDPPSLYLSSLLVYSGLTNRLDTPIQIHTFNPLLHPTFPSLSSGNPQFSSELTHSHNQIQSYLFDLNSDLTNDCHLNPTSVALESLISSRLLPLIQLHFFNFDANWKLVSRLYAAHLGIWNRSAIVGNLRKDAQVKLTKLGIWGLGNHSTSTTAKSNKFTTKAKVVEKEIQQESVPKSSEEIKQREKKLKDENRGVTSDAFGTLKILALAKEPLEILSSTLGEDDYFFNSETPKSLDFQLFSLLAPLLHTELPIKALPDCVKSFPNLVSHTSRIKDLLYPIIETPEGKSQRIGLWSSIRDEEEDEFGEEISKKASKVGILGNLAGEVWNSLPIPSIPFLSKSNRNEGLKSRGQDQDQEKGDREARNVSRIQRGRNLWAISTAVGLIGYLFFAGIISVEFDDGGNHDEKVLLEEEEQQEEVGNGVNKGGEGQENGFEKEDEEEEMEEMEDDFEEEEEFELGDDEED